MINNQLMTDLLCTQGFYITDDFLEPHYFQSLFRLADELYQKNLFSQAKIGIKIQEQQNNSIRMDEIFWLDEAESDSAIQAYLKQTHQIAEMLNQSLYLGLHEFETHFAVYQKGAFYKKHCDQFATNKTRKISCVYYLNEHWKDHYGGELKLYNREGNLIQSVFPRGNRFICFNSDMLHEVCITHQPRFSIAGWMKTRPYNL